MANKPGTRAAARPQAAETMGYPRVEKLIDTEDFAQVNEDFEAAYAELATVSRKTRGFKKSKQIKNAMKAMELTMDLFRELLSIKYRLQEMAAEEQKNRT